VKNKSFPALVFISGIVFLMVFVNLKDEILFALLFVISQLFAGGAAVLLILLRLIRILKDRSSFIYSLTGTIQMALMITDVLLLFDHNLARSTMLVFTGLNALLGIYILTDTCKRNKRTIRDLRV
jgi:hypothetical protein